ncbi:hypothetical protein GW17_00019772 [Ensete ventricosum]|uniref:Uncharacterized protein n=1 Tax=Ensete ventricosum TaxID=4639 RepID=A0A444F149_ENSVE|nr:hypothetical protein B296_00020688 [Ensete ventricosum]RWW16350.1 hypothetical protein GW17_00019772 [Ensete ventricosum]
MAARLHRHASELPSLPLRLSASRTRLLEAANRPPSALRLRPKSCGPARVMAAAASATAEEGLKKGIAEFYDQSSGLWEDIWGDHMHHGFYDRGVTASIDDHRAAQIRMIEEALRFAGVSVQWLALGNITELLLVILWERYKVITGFHLLPL